MDYTRWKYKYISISTSNVRRINDNIYHYSRYFSFFCFIFALWTFTNISGEFSIDFSGKFNRPRAVVIEFLLKVQRQFFCSFNVIFVLDFLFSFLGKNTVMNTFNTEHEVDGKMSNHWSVSVLQGRLIKE